MDLKLRISILFFFYWQYKCLSEKNLILFPLHKQVKYDPCRILVSFPVVILQNEWNPRFESCIYSALIKTSEAFFPLSPNDVAMTHRVEKEYYKMSF